MKIWNSYFWEGTKVLKNKLQIRDENLLEITETDIVFGKMRALLDDTKIIDKTYDLEYLKKIHKYLFEDIYDWAGEQRIVDMNKNNQSYYYYYNIEIGSKDLLKYPDFKQKLDLEEASRLLADSFLNVNIIHPFREGNTRTNTVFHIQMARDYGFRLDFKNIDYYELSIAKWQDDNKKIATLFRNNLAPILEGVNIKNNINALEKTIIKDNEKIVKQKDLLSVDELKNLSEQSKNSTKNIYKLLYQNTKEACLTNNEIKLLKNLKDMSEKSNGQVERKINQNKLELERE